MNTAPVVVLLLSAVLLFAPCACTPPVPVDSQSVSDRFQEAARAREAAGDYKSAVDYYLRAAATATGEQRRDILLHTADSMIRAGEFERAGAILDRVTVSQLSAALRQRLAISRAKMALARNQPDTVLDLLRSEPAAASLKVDYHRLRAEASQRTGNFLDCVRERIRLDPLLDDAEQRLANHSALWVTLNRLSVADLQQLRSVPPSDPQRGWAELAELARRHPEDIADIIQQWQMRHPEHPANPAFTEKLAGGIRIPGQPPRQLALLLPLTGTISAAAAAVREGILAAYHDMPEDVPRPAIKIYDVSGHPDSVPAVYQQAISEGAQFVIGPLRKEAIQTLARRRLLPVPVLALNRIGPDPASYPSLYQFGLAPEDEAQEVARRAWHDGHRRAIALIPQGSWGDRVYTAYLEEWRRRGGQMLEMTRYDPDEADHGAEISAILNLDGSRTRHQRLVRLLGRELEFEPRRRNDVDYIFILATPAQGRLIRPQLSFYRASRIPVYATSHVYTGHPQASLDSDMNDLLFCDIPWVIAPHPDWEQLQAYINQSRTDRSTRFNRFYALGIDAWRIIPYVEQMAAGSPGDYQGVTGNLSLDSDRRIHRRLTWARFRDGLPIPAGATESAGIRGRPFPQESASRQQRL